MVFAITMVLSRHRRAVWMDCLRGHQSTRIHLSPGGSRVATPRTLAVCSSTHLEPPWLRRPEACGCVRVPYAHLLIAGGG